MDRFQGVHANGKRYLVETVPSRRFEGTLGQSVLVSSHSYALALMDGVTLGVFEPSVADQHAHVITQTLLEAERLRFLRFGSVPCVDGDTRYYLALNYITPAQPAVVLTRSADSSLVPWRLHSQQQSLAVAAAAAESLVGEFDWMRVQIPPPPPSPRPV